MIRKVISGGQTGADIIGLETARECGIKTGGTAPKNFRTEIGNDYGLRDLGLIEHVSYRYEPRTEDNVKDSDGTVLFGDMTSSGSKQTIGFILKHGKPHISNPPTDVLISFIKDHKIEILNVAGNRGSKLTHEQCDHIRKVLFETFRSLLNQND